MTRGRGRDLSLGGRRAELSVGPAGAASTCFPGAGRRACLATWCLRCRPVSGPEGGLAASRPPGDPRSVTPAALGVLDYSHRPGGSLITPAILGGPPGLHRPPGHHCSLDGFSAPSLRLLKSISPSLPPFISLPSPPSLPPFLPPHSLLMALPPP